MRAWHHHGGITPTSRKLFATFLSEVMEAKWGWFFLIRSNVCISWMYRYRFYDIKVHFWWPYKLVFSCISIEFEHPVNTFQIGLPIHTLESIVNYDVILHSFLEKMNRDWIQGSTADFLRLAAMHPFHTYLVTTTFYLSILMKNAFVL